MVHIYMVVLFFTHAIHYIWMLYQFVIDIQ